MIYTSRLEYPRPDFVRDSWLSLNGEWDFRLMITVSTKE